MDRPTANETPRSPYDEEEPYYINAPDHHPDDLEKDMSEPEMIATTDILALLESRQEYGVLNGRLFQYSEIYPLAAEEIRRLRDRVSQLEAEENLSQSNRPGGFTLVEVLAVVVIIGILISVLLPAADANPRPEPTSPGEVLPTSDVEGK